jgi:hypothetical protein
MEHRMKEEALDIAEKSEESDDGIIEYTAAEE